jgi:hypothetical protein
MRKVAFILIAYAFPAPVTFQTYELQHAGDAEEVKCRLVEG